MNRPVRRLLLGGAGAATGRVLLEVLATRSGAGPAWRRVNYRGRPVSLLEGPAVVAAGVAGALAVPGLPLRLRAAAAVAGLGAGAVGRYDDRYGADSGRGFAGHVDAFVRRRDSSGMVKIVGIGATGLAAGAFCTRPALVDAVLAGAVVAGTANLVNLLDLRPGRAIKGTILMGLPVLVRPGPAGDLLAGPLGAAAGVLPTDLAEATMLGDAGANGLGALLGLAMAAGSNRRRLAGLLLVLATLTAASEVVSFSAVIDRVPALRWVDSLGRAPTEP